MAQTVLVAEDDRDIIELLTLYLTGSGYTVLAAANGCEALELARNNRVDIALVDLMMPQMNGYDFIKAFRQSSSAPVIIISARTQPADKIIGLDAGADGFIAKPFDPLEVCAYIRALLRRCGSVDHANPRAAGAASSTNDDARAVGDAGEISASPISSASAATDAATTRNASGAARDVRASYDDQAVRDDSAARDSSGTPGAATGGTSSETDRFTGSPSSPANAEPAAAHANRSTLRRVGDLVFDTERLTLTRHDEPIALTAAELKIMAAFMGAPGRVFSKAQLYEFIGGAAYPGSEASIMVHISNIRAKLEDDPLHPHYIVTVRGMGYRLEG